MDTIEDQTAQHFWPPIGGSTFANDGGSYAPQPLQIDFCNDTEFHPIFRGRLGMEQLLPGLSQNKEIFLFINFFKFYFYILYLHHFKKENAFLTFQTICILRI